MQKYYVDMSLARLVIIKLSSEFLRRAVFKEYLAQYIKRNYFMVFTIPDDIRKDIDELILPHQLKDELKLAIVAMGHRLTDGYSKLRSPDNPMEVVDYVDHIHWRFRGTIDYTRTIKSMYKANFLSMTNSTWMLLCEYCVEECIVDFWEKSGTSELSHLRREIVSLHDHFDYNRYWRLLLTNNLEKFKETADFFDNSLSVEEHMFQTVSYGSFDTIRYFWNCLDETQKTASCHRAIADGDDCIILNATWMRDVDSFMFAIQQFTIYGGEKFFDNLKLLPSKIPELDNWPCSRMFPMVLGEFYCHDDCPARRKEIIWTILWIMCQRRVNIGSDAEYRKWFCYFWDTYKTTLPHSYLIIAMFLYKDPESLQYIIMHETTWEDREKMLNLVVDHNKSRIYIKENKAILTELIDGLSRRLVCDWFREKFAGKNMEIEEL